MKKILPCLILATVHLCALSQKVSGDTLDRIHSIFEKWNSANTPGAVLAISRHGETVYENAWGMADLENKIPNTTSTVFPVASISKQFTAAAILFLEQQGKLSLDDDVRKYLPELPDFGNTITIRHLLNHTSGLRDWANLLLLTNIDRSVAVLNNEFVLNFLSREKELNNTPGDEFIYSNSNYTLLPLVVQRVSGKSFIEFCHRYIIDPLDLKHTEWLGVRNNEPAAVPYTSGKSFIKVVLGQKISGHAGLMTTVADLLKWNHSYLSGQLAGTSFLEKQLQPGRLNNGTIIPYAAGLRVTGYKGNKVIAHNGLGQGSVSFLEYFPEHDMSFALVANTSEINPVLMCRQVEDLFIKPRMTTNSEKSTIASTAADVTPFEGWYRNTRTGAGLQLTGINGRLVTESGDTLSQQTPKVFKTKEGLIHFRSASELTFVNSIFFPDTSYYVRVEGASKEVDIAEYSGSYFSEELSSTAIISVAGESLSLQLANKKTYKLQSSYKDGFNIEPSITTGSSCLYFVRDGMNRISGLRISIDRARNIFFVKKQ